MVRGLGALNFWCCELMMLSWLVVSGEPVLFIRPLGLLKQTVVLFPRRGTSFSHSTMTCSCRKHRCYDNGDLKRVRVRNQCWKVPLPHKSKWIGYYYIRFYTAKIARRTKWMIQYWARHLAIDLVCCAGTLATDWHVPYSNILCAQQTRQKTGQRASS